MSTTNKKPYKGVGMEGRVATWYAKNTRKDMAAFRDLADRLAAEMPSKSRILEIAPGPGYLAIELAKRGQYEISGLDISHTFVQIARENARQESVAVDFQQGDVAGMPFANDTFDLVVCRAAFKNFSDSEAALNEMFRVLRPGGRAIVIDLRKDACIKDINRYVEQLGVGWFDSVLMKLTFRYMLIPRAYSSEQFTAFASRSKFGKCGISASGIGFEITLIKPGVADECQASFAAMVEPHGATRQAR
jgi:ubiquinone/menaquinone biosynthesis C-methylase UbiE